MYLNILGKEDKTEINNYNLIETEIEKSQYSSEVEVNTIY
jgi:hypothetical protein